MSLLDLITQLGEAGYDASLLEEITYYEYGKETADGEETKLASMNEQRQNKAVEMAGVEYGNEIEIGMRAIVNYINKYKNIEGQKVEALVDKQLGVRTESVTSLPLSPTELPISTISPSDSSVFDELKRSYRGIEIIGKPISEVLIGFLKLKQDKVAVGTLANFETAGERLIMFVGDLASDQLTKHVLQENYIERRRQLPNGIH